MAYQVRLPVLLLLQHLANSGDAGVYYKQSIVSHIIRSSCGEVHWHVTQVCGHGRSQVHSEHGSEHNSAHEYDKNTRHARCEMDGDELVMGPLPLGIYRYLSPTIQYKTTPTYLLIDGL